MWAAVTLSNGSTTEVLDDNLKQKLKFLPHSFWIDLELILAWSTKQNINFILRLQTGQGTKADEFSENFQRGGGGLIFKPHIYVADFGPL